MNGSKTVCRYMAKRAKPNPVSNERGFKPDVWTQALDQSILIAQKFPLKSDSLSTRSPMSVYR